MQNEERQAYSPVSAAQALDVSRSKIYELMKSGALRYVLIGADRRIPASEVHRVANEGVPAKAPEAA